MKMTTQNKRAYTQAGAERGFTAMEVAMVATVIAILALIVIPIFRNRVNAAKIAAAQADISSLMKAEVLAHADSDFYYRLEDLDNTTNSADPSTVPPPLGVTIETPIMAYSTNRSGVDTTRNPVGMNLTQWRGLAGTVDNPRFKGPYATFTKVEEYATLRNTFPIYFRSTNGNQYAAIRDIPQGSPMAGHASLFDAEDNRIPIDPWGNPYLFFPAVPYETAYNYNCIISLGPNGLPGDGTDSITYEDYRRESNPGTTFQLGKDDDIEVRF
jgi:prepilin-type N-terminal cleavage/methylation domain-containing protein